MKKLLSFIFVIFLLNVTCFSSGDGRQISDFANPDWKLYETINGIEIYYKSEECHDLKKGMHKEFVLLKFVNTTEENLVIKWDNYLWYDGNCLTCIEDAEYKFSVQLSAKESREGGCEYESELSLKLFSRFLNYSDKPELTMFELANLKVLTK
ncbi:MAG: hypothetical protein ABIJ97_00040 [Bacteroidota bacterium]